MSFLARILNPAGIGMYSAILSSSASVNQVCDLGTTVVLQRTGARIHEIGEYAAGYRLTIIFLLQFLLNLAISLTIYYYPEIFNKTLLFNIAEEDTIQAIGILAMLQVLAQVPLTFALGLGEFRIYAIRMMVGNLLILAISIIYVIIFGNEIVQVINATIIAWVLNTLYSFLILKRMLSKHRIPVSLKNIRSESSSIFKEGFVYYLGNTFSGAVYNIVILSLFSKYIGIGEYGFVRMAAALVAILGVLPAALQPVTISILAGNYEGRARFKSLQLRFVTIFSFIITVVLIFFVEEAIQILFGRQYLRGKQVFEFMIMMNFIILMSSLISNFLVAKGQASYIGKVSIFCTLLNIIFCFLLVPSLGLYGYFMAYAVGYGLGFVFVLIREFRLGEYPDYAHLKKLGIFLLILMAAILPVLFITNFYIALGYKILYLVIMMTLLIPLSLNSVEMSKVMVLLKTRPSDWLKPGN